MGRIRSHLLVTLGWPMALAAWGFSVYWTPLVWIVEDLWNSPEESVLNIMNVMGLLGTVEGEVREDRDNITTSLALYVGGRVTEWSEDIDFIAEALSQVTEKMMLASAEFWALSSQSMGAAGDLINLLL